MVVVLGVVSGGAILLLQTIGRNPGCARLCNFYTELELAINFHSSVSVANRYFFLKSLVAEGK